MNVCLDALTVLREPGEHPVNAADHILAGIAEIIRRVGKPPPN